MDILTTNLFSYRPKSKDCSIVPKLKPCFQ